MVMEGSDIMMFDLHIRLIDFSKLILKSRIFFQILY